MNSEIYKSSLRNMIFQRNAFFALSIILATSLTLVVLLLFWKSERIVIVPSVIEKEFWIEPRSVSGSYLEQMGLFLGELLLSKSAGSAPIQRTVLLRHTDPSYYTQLQKKLLEEEVNLEKEKASYVFFPANIHTDINSKEVIITGDRTTYISGKILSTNKESYVLSFNLKGSRLLLQGITTKDIEK